jgi:DNA-binding GntR family transcriptional regulator
LETNANINELNLEKVFSSGKSKQDEAYEIIKQLIVTNKLAQGTVLVERNLSDLLNISRTPIRAALRQLVNENMVVYYPGMGMAVASLKIDDVVEIYQIRESLDILAIRLFLQRNNKTLILQMKEHVQKMGEALQENNLEKFAQHDLEFHNCYLNNTGNNRLQNIIITLHDQIRRYLSLAGTDEAMCRSSYEDHSAVIEAIDEIDFEKAEKMIYDHIVKSRKYHVDKLTIR